MEHELPAAGPPLDRLGTEAMADCVALVVAARWNQIAADWQVFFDHGQVLGVRDGVGRVVASAALLPYPPGWAWVSMVLTDPAHRGHGHAGRLVAALLTKAEACGLTPQLDATPAGEPVYARLGFTRGLKLTRWRRPGRVPTALEPQPALAASDLEQIIERDAAALGGVWRRPVLAALAARGPRVFTATGHALSRMGRTAHHIGPVVAGDPDEARCLVDQLIGCLPQADAVVVDAVDDSPGMADRLYTHGFLPERPFRRMVRGVDSPADPQRYAVAAGPELG